MTEGRDRHPSGVERGPTGERGSVPPAPSAETEIDWASARIFLQRALRCSLDRVEPDLVQDLTQEALVRLLRAVRREEPMNLDALMTEIARRTRIDFIRKRRTWSAILGPLDESDSNRPDAHGSAPDQLGDPCERLEFVVTEFFRMRHAPCLELARRYFDEQDWVAVAADLGRGNDAVRQQWSRCLAMLRKASADNPGLLAAWAAPTDQER